MTFKPFLVVLLEIVLVITTNAQRNYTAHSVLASGNWYKIGVTRSGVYKIDVNFLNQLGISSNNIASASIQLFGNGGGMLPENNAIPRLDDLTENAIAMYDGGDGIFNNTDYFLFYASGTTQWKYDSAQKKFNHQKNLYSDTAYYYITIGNIGKRIATQNSVQNPTIYVSTYNERYFYENDITNFLSSGKEWYGESFGNDFAANQTKSFALNFSDLVLSQPCSIATSFAARSIAGIANFTTVINGQTVQQVNMPSVSGYFLDAYATASTQSTIFTATTSPSNITINFLSAAQGANGWLNWFEFFARRKLDMGNQNQLLFRDIASVGAGNVANFTINNTNSSTLVWDITNSLNPIQLSTLFSNNQTTFNNNSSELREYIAFNNSGFLAPVIIGKIVNQDLHAIAPADLIIITHPNFLSQANRLANFHIQHDGYSVAVITTNEIYNEFSSGISDPSAIRDFVKMLYDKSTPAAAIKYILLFGAGSYNYKNRLSANTNWVPAYESDASLDPLTTYTSDDFYGLLKDKDNIADFSSPSVIDIGIGRLPARTVSEATIMIDKLIHYYASSSLGSWRNQSVFVADNGDNNLHLNDAEAISADALIANSYLNQQKIYNDAYKMVSGSSGTRFPSVNTAIVNAINNGVLLFNYNGHGGYQQLSGSAIFTQNELQQFTNADKLPLFITATCDFAPYDDPSKNSLGGKLLYGDSTGAIALMTTTRPVFAASNKIMNDNYLKIALQPNNSGKYNTLGQAVQLAKNYTYQTYSDVLNNRKFTLLGDPAMKLAFPENKVIVTTINGKPLAENDSVKALNKYEFGGKITDALGNFLPTYNGVLQITVFDKPQEVSTLGNDAASFPVKFYQQTNVLYKGIATIKNGVFTFSFIVPKDINYQSGNGKISLYANDGKTDATGVYNSLTITGNNNALTVINSYPSIQLYLNDTLFRDGGITNEHPILLANVFDSLGINTSATSIGHDIELMIDGDRKNSIILNNAYQAAINSYQFGSIYYQLPFLTEGWHTITVKIWNVANNSAEATIHFKVIKQQQITIDKLFNYPNPFTNSTTISFEHNQTNIPITVNIEIYSSNGQLQYSKKNILIDAGSRSTQIQWDGRGNAGNKLKNGIYFYRIIVQSVYGSSQAVQKLILL